MRSTVGPLPPAVYWRRRVIVLGAILLVLLAVVYACQGSTPHDAGAVSSPTPKRTAPATAPSTSGGATSPATASPQPGATSSTTPDPAVAALPPCADTDIAVTAAVDRDPIPSGAVLQVKLRIKNTSAKPCSRNVGASQQEALVRQGDKRIWSSDDCNPPASAKDPDVVALAPGVEQEFHTFWHTTTTSNQAGCKDKVLAPLGAYEIVIRFGAKLSNPLPIKVT